MKPVPVVSVVISVFNGEDYIAQTLDSLLAQDLHAWECIVVDDGSTDTTRTIVERYCRRDERFTLMPTSGGNGPYRAANLAFPKCRGTYIARIDADDINMPNRLSAQTAYLDTHPDIMVCGALHDCLFEDGRIERRSYDTHPDFLRWQLLFRNMIVHSTMMLRKTWFEALGYYPSKRLAQDYFVWQKAAIERSLCVLKEPLVRWRIHSVSITKAENADQLAAAAETSERYIHEIPGVSAEPEVVKSIVGAIRGTTIEPAPDLVSAVELILSLFERYRSVSRPDEAILRKIRNDCHRTVFAVLWMYRGVEGLQPLRRMIRARRIGRSLWWYRALAHLILFSVTPGPVTGR